jgi:hypothetical protein
MFGLGLELSIVQAPKLKIELKNLCKVCGEDMQDDASRREAIAANSVRVTKYSFCTGCGNYVELDRSHGYKCRWTRRAKKRLRTISEHGLNVEEISLVSMTHTDAVRFIQLALVVLYRRGEIKI